jgi:Glycosyl-hydrolase 97 N-terminal
VTWSVRSPAGRLRLEAASDGDGRLRYRVLHADAEVVAPSRLGIVRFDTTFDTGLELLDPGSERLIEDRYTLRHGKQLSHDVRASERTLLLRNADGAHLAVDVRAYDEGLRSAIGSRTTTTPRRPSRAS